MKLKLDRSQKSGMISSKITFTLFAQTELTDEEAGYVNKYKMGKEVLYERIKLEGGAGVIGSVAGGMLGIAAGAATALAKKALNLTITVDDLVNGKNVECKDIIEMRAAEEQLKEACETFKVVLESAAHFEGTEILEF